MAQNEKNQESAVKLPGSEGLKPFGWNGANKFELQTANDLFDAYSIDKDPRTLGKINALKLDIMKRAAEAEIAKLTPERTRAQIEAEMKEKQVSSAQANDELAYVLVTYLRNIEKLGKERESAVAAETAKANAEQAKLKASLPAVAPAAETVIVKPAVKEASKPADKAPEAALDPEELKSEKFIKEHRAEIDALVAKIPEGNAKTTFSGLLDKPTKASVTVLQTEIGLKVGTKDGADGRFGKITLGALKKYVEAGGKKPVESVVKPVAKPTVPKEKPKTKKEKEEEVRKQEEARKQSEAEAEAKKKAEAERVAKEKEVDTLQKKTLQNLKAGENGVYVVDTKFFKDGFAGAVFFKFDAKNGEWLWNSFNNPDEMKSNPWQKVSRLAESTKNGKTDMSVFGFNESTQETVNAMLAAGARAKELGVPLKDPSAPSPIGKSAAPEAKPKTASATVTYTPETLAEIAAKPDVASIKDISPAGHSTPRTAPPARIASGQPNTLPFQKS